MPTMILTAPAATASRLALRLWLWRERRDLERLDAHLLKDIGVSPAEAFREAARPFWDVPNSRR